MGRVRPIVEVSGGTAVTQSNIRMIGVIGLVVHFLTSCFLIFFAKQSSFFPFNNSVFKRDLCENVAGYLGQIRDVTGTPWDSAASLFSHQILSTFLLLKYSSDSYRRPPRLLMLGKCSHPKAYSQPPCY